MTWGNVTWPVPPTPTGASLINSLTNQSLKHQQYISREENECKHYEIMFQNYPGEGHEMARGGNPTVVFDSKRQQVPVYPTFWQILANFPHFSKL